MKKFALGAVAGMSSLALAVPMFAHIAGAQSSAVSSASSGTAPTQACVAAMATMEQAHLSVFDAMTAQHKTELQARAASLKDIAAIADDTQRQAALQALHDAKRTVERPAPPQAVTDAMEAVRAACGDTMRMNKMMHGGHMGDKGRGGFMMKRMFKDEVSADVSSSVSSVQ
jgi:hypothetical protein